MKGARSLNRQLAEQYTQINLKILMQQNRGFIDENKVGTVVKSYEKIFSRKTCMIFFLSCMGRYKTRKSSIPKNRNWLIYLVRNVNLHMVRIQHAKSYLKCRMILFVCLMVFNVTFKSISVISWQSVLLVEEIGVPRENHQPVASH